MTTRAKTRTPATLPNLPDLMDRMVREGEHTLDLSRAGEKDAEQYRYRLPGLLPFGWLPVRGGIADNYDAVFENRSDGRRVIISTAPHTDGRWWLHLSVSRRDRIPSYQDLTEAKALFIGRDRKAIMVLPPEDRHVNLHSRCLHLYASLDDDPLPEFSGTVAGVRTI